MTTWATNVRMRFRRDDRWAAESAAWRARGDSRSWFGADDADGQAEIAATPPAVPGDVWAVHWWAKDGDGPLAGYSICCPHCGDVHDATSASNCARNPSTGACVHSGVSSCWSWTGSAEQNTLTASPSLHFVGACGWHGWLRDGVFVSC